MNTTAMNMNKAEFAVFDEYRKLFETKKAAWDAYGDLMTLAWKDGALYGDQADAAHEEAREAEKRWVEFCHQHPETKEFWQHIAAKVDGGATPGAAPRATMRWQNNYTNEVVTIDHTESPDVVGGQIVVVLVGGDKWQWDLFYKHFHLLGEL